MDGPGLAADPPLVTVAVGCYNHARFLVQALDAVAAQTYAEIELIVTDDGSTDGSPELIAEWIADNRPDATFIHHEVNQGACRVMNGVLDVAAGTYISMISADDWMEPRRVERLVEEFEGASERVGLVYSGLRVVDEAGEEMVVLHGEQGALPQGSVYAQLLARPFIPAPTVMLRRSVFDAVGRYREDDPAEDYDMWLRIAREHEVRHVPEILVNYRVHPEQTTQVKSPEVLRSYVIACLTRHLGVSAETDEIIQRRIARLRDHPELTY